MNANRKDYFTQSALKEISLLRKHFHIKGVGDDVFVADEITSNDVSSFTREYFASVRPPNLSDNKIIPQVDTQKLRCLFIGNPDVNIILNLVVRHCLYVDQIVLPDPFNDLPYHMINERPEAWLEIIINRALCICSLEDWIREEVVLVVPSLSYYFPETKEFIKENEEMFFSKIKGFEKEIENEYILRLLVNEHPSVRDSLFDVFEKMGKKYSEEEKANLLDNALRYESKYPIRFRLTNEHYDKYFKKGETRSQIFNFSYGISLLLAPFLASEIGAFMVFERRYIYEMMAQASLRAVGENQKKETNYEQLAIAFQQLDLPFLHNIPINKALELRKKGYLSRFRVYLRNLWLLSLEKSDTNDLNDKLFEFTDRLKSEYEALKLDLENIKKELRIKAVTSGLAIGVSAGSALAFGNISITLGAFAGIAGLSATLFKEQMGGYANLAEKFHQKNNQPLFVFFELEK